MKGLSSWASGVIVAIIAAKILEMLLPEGNNKKYIKVIIGIYVLFTIISPVVSGLLDEEFNIEAIFASASEYEYSTEQVEANNDKLILSTYTTNLKEDVKKKLSDKGYKADEINIEVGTNEANYGQIQKMDIIVSKMEEEKKVQEIEKIDINISNKAEEKVKIPQKEVDELRKYLAETYEIDENNIIIV